MYVVQVLEDLLGAQVVQARHAAVHVALHGEGLAGASLAVCETCDFRPQEGAVDEGLDAGVINQLVVGVFVKSVVEIEAALLHVLGEVDLLPVSNRIHLISLIRTVFWSRIRIISFSPRASSFLFRGRFRITTVILGGSCFEYISGILSLLFATLFTAPVPPAPSGDSWLLISPPYIFFTELAPLQWAIGTFPILFRQVLLACTLSTRSPPAVIKTREEAYTF